MLGGVGGCIVTIGEWGEGVVLLVRGKIGMYC